MTEESKNPVGRPTKFDDSFCERAIALGRDGKSHAQIAANLGVTRETLYQWAKENDQFSDAMSLARELSLNWWEEQAQQGIWAGKEFNAAVWNKSVTARFPLDYGERKAVELTGKDGGAIQTESSVTLTADEAYKLMLEGKS